MNTLKYCSSKVGCKAPISEQVCEKFIIITTMEVWKDETWGRREKCDNCVKYGPSYEDDN